jgi:hypothetical protein
MIENILTLSTAHLPETSPDFYPARAIEHEYGYVVFVFADPPSPFPGWLTPIMGHALKSKCTLILFDRDAPTDPMFRTYEW